MPTGIRPAADTVTPLEALIDNRECIESHYSVADVGELLTAHRQEFVAVCEQGRAVGLCSRAQIRGLLSGRYGFALHSRDQVRRHMLTGALMLHDATSVRQALETALTREGDAFYQDVLVVDAAGGVVGLISTRRLVDAQSALVEQQFTVVGHQREELEVANRQLLQSLAQREALERQVIQKEKAALVETLAGGVAHEINNKLVPIVGYAELLLEELQGHDRSEELMRYCHALLDGALDSSRIISQLLQLSRPARTEWEVCDLAALVPQSLTLVGLRLKETGTEVALELPEGQVLVRADGAQLKQLLMNLILNGMDAMDGTPDRRLTISLAVRASMACVAVRDLGSGIAPVDLPRIFDPFFTTKGPSRGTGLGLGVCASIMKQHGGEILVDSDVGRGSTFSFELPLLVGTSATPDAPRAVVRGTPRPERPRALVVDDDAAVAQLTAETLRRLFHYDVVRASDGDGGRRALLAGDFDIVFCDIRMPVMNGLELATWLRHHRRSMLDRLVLMTGDAGTGLDDEIRKAGVPVLRKPFSQAALADTLARVSAAGSAA